MRNMRLVESIIHLPLPVLHHWGYWLILLAAALESSPLFGLLIPGQLIVIAGGFLAKLGILEIGDVMWVAAVGAIVGDIIGFLLGKEYGFSLIAKYGKYVFFRQERFERTKHFVHNNSGKALIVGRFNSFTRSLAPFMAGAGDVSFFKFLSYNVIGGAGWAIIVVLAGYLFGASYEVAARYIGRFMIIAVVVSIGVAYVYRFINARKHVFSKYHLFVLMVNVVSLYVFAKMIDDIVNAEFITRLDAWVQTNIILWHSSFLDRLMTMVTNIFSPAILLLTTLLLVAVFIRKKQWHYALVIFFGMMGGAALEAMTKRIIHRPRPEHAFLHASGFSFPSGHATMAIIFFTVLLLAFNNDIKNRVGRHVFTFGITLIILLIGFSRVYLSMHWTSDVVGGFSLGLFWLTLVILILKTLHAMALKAFHAFTKIVQDIFS